MIRPATRAVFAGFSAAAYPALAQDRDQNRAVVGLSAIHTPAYQGADKYRTLPFPVIDLSYGRFFLSGRAGAGAKVIDGLGAARLPARRRGQGRRGLSDRQPPRIRPGRPWGPPGWSAR